MTALTGPSTPEEPVAPSAPIAPGLSHVFDIVAEVGQVMVPTTGPVGRRQFIPITGGKVFGPRLQGRILPGGADYALLREDGASVIDARYTIEVDDGALVHVHSTGLRVSSPEVLERMRRGEVVAPSEVYFRGTPLFEAPQGPHDWLNRHLFVATICRHGQGVRLNVFSVE